MSITELETRLATLEAEMVSIKEKLEHSQNCAKVERGITQMNRGDGLPAREALEALRKKYNIAAT